MGKVKNGTASKPLPREIEDGKRPDLCLCRSLFLAARDRDRRNEVASVDCKLKIAVAPGRHGQIEYGLTSPTAQIQRRYYLLRWRNWSGLQNDVRRFGSTAVKAKISELSRRVGENRRGQYSACLSRG